MRKERKERKIDCLKKCQVLSFEKKDETSQKS